MIIEIPFNKNLSHEQAWVMFNDVWYKNVRVNNRRIFYSIGFIIFGVAVLYGKSMLGLLFIGFGVYLFLRYSDYYHSYTTSKKQFHLELEEILEKYEVSNTTSFWDFNDEFFGYKDSYYDIKINWEVIKSYKIIKDMIIINVNQTNKLGYAISRKEVPSQTFDAIVDILKSKIATQGLS
jgi:hypothetical protein